MSKRLKKNEWINWMTIFDNNLVVNNIVGFLPIISIMAIVRSIPTIRKRLTKSIYCIAFERILALLNKNISQKALTYLIQKRSMCLTGSSLLGALMNAEWINSLNDIDMCSYETSPDLMVLANAHNAIHPARHRYTMAYPHSAVLQTVTNYKRMNTGSVDIQVLTVSDIHCYVSTFDLNFCKNYLSSAKLVVMNPFSILKREATLNIEHYLNTQLKTHEYVIHTYLPSRYLRLEKYVGRGFDIALKRTRYSWRDMKEYLKDSFQGEPEDLIAICAFWGMFWSDRIGEDEKLIVGKYPEWKRGDIPRYYKTNH